MAWHGRRYPGPAEPSRSRSARSWQRRTWPDLNGRAPRPARPRLVVTLPAALGARRRPPAPEGGRSHVFQSGSGHFPRPRRLDGRIKEDKGNHVFLCAGGTNTKSDVAARDRICNFHEDDEGCDRSEGQANEFRCRPRHRPRYRSHVLPPSPIWVVFGGRPGGRPSAPPLGEHPHRFSLLRPPRHPGRHLS